MPKVVLFSYHYLRSKRRAGFHWLADAYWRLGWEVVFVTAPISYLSWLRRDHRFRYPVWQEANRLVRVEERLYSYVLFTLVHPARTRLILGDRLSEPLFRAYPYRALHRLFSELEVGGAPELFIFESTPFLLAYHRLRSRFPGARYVYRVSDDVRFLKLHPLVIAEEEHLAPCWDLVSVPTRLMYERFRELGARVELHPHAVAKDLFDSCMTSPYDPDTVNLVFVGTSHLDVEFYRLGASLFPAYRFYIVGPFNRHPSWPENVRVYGEMPMRETVPYIKFANVGLQTRSYSPGAETLADSLKVVQYSYCGLPIVAPDFLYNGRLNMHYYIPGDAESIRCAIASAVEQERCLTPAQNVLSWEELARKLAGERGASR